MAWMTYGSHRHDDDECSFTTSVSTEDTQTGYPAMRVENWTVSGRLQGDDPKHLNEKIRLMTVAYSRHFQDLIFYHNDGTPLRGLLNQDSTSGVKVLSGPNFPSIAPGQFTTFIDYSISLQAKYFANILSSSPLFGGGVAGPPGGAGTGGAPGAPSSPEGVITSFRESISFSGGGPLYAMFERLRLKPQRQKIKNHTTYRCSQSGSATGYLRYPVAPPPLFPDWLVQSPGSTLGSPTREGNRFTNYPITWSYNFESSEPMVGVPHRF